MLSITLLIYTHDEGTRFLQQTFHPAKNTSSIRVFREGNALCSIVHAAQSSQTPGK